MFDTNATDQGPGLTPTVLEKDLLAGRYNDTWKSKGTRDRKRAALRKGKKKVFKKVGGFLSEEEYPATRAEVEFFAARHLQTDEGARRASFANAEKAEQWVAEYCTVLDVASGYRDAVANMRLQDDDWADLLAHLSGQNGGPVVFDTYEIIRVSRLAMVCRERGITINGLDSMVFAEMFVTLTQKQQASAMKGLRQLCDLHGSDYVPVELLPNVDRTEIEALAPARTRVIPPIHPDFAKLMQRFLTQSATGKVTALFGTKIKEFNTKSLSADRIKNLNDAMRWLWSGMVALDLANHNRPFDHTCLRDGSLIFEVVEACETGKLGSSINSETRRARMLNAIIFLDWNCAGYRERIPPSFYYADAIRQCSDDETHDRRKKRIACLDFVHSAEQQRQFFLMPKIFFDQAKPIVDAFRAHIQAGKNERFEKMNLALELGIMAALTAINTLYPARLKTLMQFGIGGDQPNVRFPDDDRKDSLVLDIPGYMVKNGNSLYGLCLDPVEEVSPREILRWYIDEVHPLVLRYKHKPADLRRPDLLFTGLHIDTVRSYWRCHTAVAGLNLTPHMCRHFTASLLLGNGVSPLNVSRLLGISEAVTIKNYGFMLHTQMVQNVIKKQTEIFRNLEK